MITIESDGPVTILRQADGDNRLTLELLDAVDEVFDRLASPSGPAALVTTGHEHYFSNGLDLAWMGENKAEVGGYLQRVHRMFGRMLQLPCPTVAAINGHAFAGGAMWSLSHDHRVMRNDRGYFCLPEVDLGMSFTPGMQALITERMPFTAAQYAMTTGHRYGASEAVTHGIVHSAVAADHVLEDAVAIAAQLAPHAGHVLATIRTELHAKTIELLVS